MKNNKVAQLDDKDIEKLPFDNEGIIEASKLNDCKEFKLCKPVGFFELIEKCDLCGKLL